MTGNDKKFHVIRAILNSNHTQKVRIVMHLVHRAHRSGNPKWATAFLDEEFNGKLAKLASVTVRSTFYRRVLARFRGGFGNKRRRI